MRYNTPAIRDLIADAFSSEEFAIFCSDHAQSIRKHFPENSSLLMRAQLLVEYAERHGELDAILEAVRAQNPYAHKRYEARLVLPSEPPADASSTNLLRALSPPLQQYDALLTRLFGELRRWDGASATFARCALAGIASAVDTVQAYLLRGDGVSWQPVLALDELGVIAAERLFGGSAMRAALREAQQRKTPVQFRESGARAPHLIVPCPGDDQAQLLVLLNVQPAAPIDATTGLVLETILSATQQLSVPISIDALELKVYHQLYCRLGPVSDAVAARAFALFVRRLGSMTVYFEPVVHLHPSQPYIWGWEALARDPETRRAPNDLFDIAEVWGTRFQLELDIHLLRLAVERYIALPSETNPGRYLRRKEEILPLSVNVYPESLVRTRYLETVRELYENGRMPMNKLTFEFSERASFPRPEGVRDRAEALRSFREHMLGLRLLDVRFAIDDFGSGDGSASLLAQIGPDCVKIGCDDLLGRSGPTSLDTALDLARSAPGRVQVIVEGVDDERRMPLWALYERGIRYVQGRSLGVARPAADRLDRSEFNRICEALRASGTP